MRRSSSTSHIPLPKSDFRPRSKSSIRTSNKDIGSSASKNQRAGSVERLIPPPLKRSTSSTALKKPSITTPILQTTIRPSVRSGGTTPASSRSRSKSPYKVGSAQRNLNDKKWVHEQHIKVCSYLRRHPKCAEHVPDMLKPPTIETFVYVIDILLKEIDPQVTINKANYKEEVLKRLKYMHFPGTISSSLMKTVNTMHAWPQVMCIFAWLVDLIFIINPDQNLEAPKEDDIKFKKIDCVTNYLINRYILYNQGGSEKDADKAFILEMESILGKSCNELDRKNILLRQEVAELNNLKEDQNKKLEEIENQNNVIKKQIEDLELEIETAYTESEMKEKEMDHVIKHLRDRKSRLNEEIKGKEENIAALQEKIKQQPCTYEEKCKMVMHIDELKHTLDLKKESLVAKKELKSQRALLLTEARKEIETNIYHLNKQLMGLILIKPELKVLQLSEKDFTSKEFGGALKRVIENTKKFEKQFNERIEFLKKSIVQIKQENELLLQKREGIKNEIKTVEKQERKVDENIATYNQQLKILINETENYKNMVMDKIKKLEETAPDTASLKTELKRLQDLKNEKQINFENVMKETLIFFEKLNVEFMGHLEKLNEIRTEIFDLLKGCVDDIDTEEENILQDLKTLLPYLEKQTKA